MDSLPGADKPQRPALWKRALALLVLLAVIALALKVAVGLIVTVFWIVLALAAIVAVLWALNTLL